MKIDITTNTVRKLLDTVKRLQNEEDKITKQLTKDNKNQVILNSVELDSIAEEKMAIINLLCNLGLSIAEIVDYIR